MEEAYELLTLLLKVVQSVEERQPCTEPEAVSQFKVLLDQVRPVPPVILLDGAV